MGGLGVPVIHARPKKLLQGPHVNNLPSTRPVFTQHSKKLQWERVGAEKGSSLGHAPATMALTVSLATSAVMFTDATLSSVPSASCTFGIGSGMCASNAEQLRPRSGQLPNVSSSPARKRATTRSYRTANGTGQRSSGHARPTSTAVWFVETATSVAMAGRALAADRFTAPVCASNTEAFREYGGGYR